jgi:apolipoprotein N-acyltransferase
VTSTATDRPVPTPAGLAARPSPILGLGPRLAAAVVSGAVVAVSMPRYDVWPAAPLGVAGFLLLARGQRPRRAALLGLAFGLGFFLPVLSWSGVYVGALPWVLLALCEAAFLALVGAGVPLLWRLPAAPVWLACWWVAGEALRSRIPFGGFPWGRLAFGVVDSPYAGLAALGGAPLVSFGVALTGALLAAAVVALVAAPQRMVTGVVVLAAAAMVLVSGWLVPTPTGATRGATVAIVQGNVPAPGLEFNAERERVLRNHVAATHQLAREVRSGRVAAPDLVLWPENSSDIDPLEDPSAGALIQAAVDDVGVPVLVGAVLDGPGRFLSNAAILWRPGTGPGSGPGREYVKRHPAPFGEYIPLRSLARRVSSKVDLVARDFTAGNRVGIFRMGPATVGDVICFEVAYDGLVRDTVRAGADLLVVQTNNATFGFTAEAAQQLAMTRLRAIEHGRAAVQVSTVGISALVSPDGSVLTSTTLFTRAVRVARLPLRTQETVATRVGAWPEGILSLLGAAVLVLAAGTAVRRRRVGTA